MKISIRSCPMDKNATASFKKWYSYNNAPIDSQAGPYPAPLGRFWVCRIFVC
jgi:hypothetical protein